MKQTLKTIIVLLLLLVVALAPGCKKQKSRRASQSSKAQTELPQIVEQPLQQETPADKQKKQGRAKAEQKSSLLDKFAIESIEGLEGSLLTGWTLKLRVRNDSAFSPRITDATGCLYSGEQLVARVRLVGEVEVPKRQTTALSVPLSLSIDNPLLALSLLGRLKSRNFDGLEASMSATVEVMSSRRTIEIVRTDITTILKQLGYTL